LKALKAIPGDLPGESSDQAEHVLPEVGHAAQRGRGNAGKRRAKVAGTHRGTMLERTHGADGFASGQPCSSPAKLGFELVDETKRYVYFSQPE